MAFRVPRFTPPRVPMYDMAGKLAVVTGASAGIGLETARGLAQRGASVCIVGRDPARTEASAAAVREVARGGQVDHLLCDFERLDQVRALAAALLERHRRIDVLVNNAGLWIRDTRLGEGGVEVTILVNHVAPFLLTHLLRERLVESAPSRVVNVSSRLHIKEKKLDVDAFFKARSLGGLSAYRQSKLANVLFSAELAERLRGTGVTSNSVHPGDVATDVVRDSKLLSFGLKWVGRLYLLTAEEGARTSLHAACSPELEHVTGRYFANCREARASRLAEDRALRAWLWDISTRLAGL